MTGAAIAALAVLLLAACTRDPFVNTTIANTTPAGDWRIEKQVDRITGKPVSNAMLMSRQVSNASVLVAPPAHMQLACFKERPAVLIAFDFKIGSTRNAEFGYRFDDRPGHEPRVRIVEDYKRVVIEDPNEVARFTNELATSDVLYVRIRSLNAGRTSAEFHVAQAPAAIAAAYAGCPLTPGAHASAAPPAGRDDKDDKED
jgi:hypothetical protein